MKNIEKIKQAKLNLSEDISLTPNQIQKKALFYNDALKVLRAELTEKQLDKQLLTAVLYKKNIDVEWELKIMIYPKLDTPKHKADFYKNNNIKELNYACKLLTYILEA